MKRIRLTTQGEYLLLQSFTFKTAHDDMKLVSCIGSHEFCAGWMNVVQVSETQQALHCRRCNFRLVIPLVVNTWKKLEAHMLDVVADAYLKEERGV